MIIANILLFWTLVQAQYPPTPTGLTVINSTSHSGVKISYKEVPGNICGGNSTTSYAGYVKFPPNTMSGVDQNYPVNLFFWYSESQSNNSKNDPLSIFFNGGPGSASDLGLFVENGPCYIHNDSKTSEPNKYSWNKYSNMLWVDQPVQTGFSYDNITEGVMDLITGEIIPGGEPTSIQIPGTFSSQNVNRTANTTENAAIQFWYFLQAWTGSFDKYTAGRENFSINIWTESYGGRYGPAFARYILEKNKEIETNGTNATVLSLKTLGIINGCIDISLQEPSYPSFAYNNSYGIVAINESVKAMAEGDLPTCLNLVSECQELARTLDPNATASNEHVNNRCRNATEYCEENIEGPYVAEMKWGYYDIAHCYLDPFPPEYYVGFLAQPEVQQALGVPVNYTESSPVVEQSFVMTGDYARNGKKGYTNDIAYLLDSGVQVALVYGDRDYACNWVGGEAVSLSVNYSQANAFKNAGYEEIVLSNHTNQTWGAVRQHGSYSFTRVYQSGHMVPSYQPELALELFRRSLFNLDLATGQIDLLTQSNYSTPGPANSTHTEKPPAQPSPTCYFWYMPSSCADNQISAVIEGKAEANELDTGPSNTGHGVSVRIGIKSELLPSFGIFFLDLDSVIICLSTTLLCKSDFCGCVSKSSAQLGSLRSTYQKYGLDNPN
ncbi:hypothetical protein EMPG_10645 [Blastomyces silverae]|uniref:Carboxypeptidase n=1 Tax=Blastomyces silverae TaxID=2060906 RepID=A0A0H1B4L4_9EURO|nr:hypothetical protein EMPG_10645 [Blastomyces silverae]